MRYRQSQLGRTRMEAANRRQPTLPAVVPVILRTHDAPYSFCSHPLRRTGRNSLLASSLLVNRMFFASHSSLPGTRSAIAPSASHSMYFEATENSETPGAPPCLLYTSPSPR